MEEAPSELEHLVQVPEFLLRLLPQVLTPPEHVIFHVLYTCSWGTGKPDCRIGYMDLGRQAKLAPSTVVTAVRGLTKKGLITVQEKRNRNQPLGYTVSRDARDYIGLPESLRPVIYKPSAADIRVINDSGKAPAPAEERFERLRVAVFTVLFDRWLAEARVRAPNALVERLLRAGAGPENRVLRDFYFSMAFEPWIKAALETGSTDPNATGNQPEAS